MAATVWGLLRRLLASLAVASLGLAAVPVPAAAPASGTLYAVANGTELVSVDPTTGAQTPIASVGPPAQPFLLGSLVPDPASSLIYANASYCICNGKGGAVIEYVATIDTRTGTAGLSPQVSQLLSGGMALDPVTRHLWSVTACCPINIVNVDPATGVATTLATAPIAAYVYGAEIAQDTAAHMLYVSFGQNSPLNLVTFNTVTDALTATTMLTSQLSDIGFDSSSRVLLGLTASSPNQLVKVDPASGAETPIATFGAASLALNLAVDSTTHTAYVDFFDSSHVERIAAVNDQTGAMSVGAATANISGLAFRAAPAAPVTNLGLRQDLERAHALGAIPSAEIESSLMAKLTAAGNAMATGQCRLADGYYQAFINQLESLTPTQAAPATASRLITEAESLIVVCR